jgi:hypothetical protein
MLFTIIIYFIYILIVINITMIMIFINTIFIIEDVAINL